MSQPIPLMRPEALYTPYDVQRITGWSYDDSRRACQKYGVRPGKRRLYISPVVLSQLLHRPWELEPDNRPRVVNYSAVIG